MSTLAENAAAVKAAQVAIDEAIVAKGGTTTGGLTNAAAAIEALPSGVKYGEWTPPSDWPDIRKILEDNWPANTDYDAACIYLLTGAKISNSVFGGTVTRIVNSDGVVNTENNNDAFVDIRETELRWVAKYGYHDQIKIVNAIKRGTLWAHFVNVDFNDVNSTYVLSDVYNIVSYTGTVNVNYSGNFPLRPCAALENIFEIRIADGITTKVDLSITNIKSLVGKLDFSRLNDISKCFQINGLIELPDVLDLSNCENCTGAFHSVYRLQKFPTHLTANGNHSLAISFPNIDYIVDKSTFADFDAEGNLTGGLAYNINDLSTSPSPPTLTLSSRFKSRFSASEQTTIVNQFVSRGWSLSW